MGKGGRGKASHRGLREPRAVWRHLQEVEGSGGVQGRPPSPMQGTWPFPSLSQGMGSRHCKAEAGGSGRAAGKGAEAAGAALPAPPGPPSLLPGVR